MTWEVTKRLLAIGSLICPILRCESCLAQTFTVDQLSKDSSIVHVTEMSQQRPIVAMHGDSIEGRWYDLVLYGRSIARPMLDAVTMQASSIVELSAVKDTSEWASGMFQFITKTGRLRGALEMKSGHILRIWDYHWPVVLVYVFDNALQTGLPIVLLEEYHYGKDRYADKNGCLVFNSRSEQRVIHCGVGLQQALEWTLQHNTLPE